jgi:hypothetical protein
MSNETLYPLGIGASVKLTAASAVVSDTFESGATATRRLWPTRNFKHRIQLSHPVLTVPESRALREFWDARDGKYGAFWIRDNVEREGNRQVRFASDLERAWQAGARGVDVTLAEIAPRRSLPNLAEITTAAGTAPSIWLDANRQRGIWHINALTTDTTLWDTVLASAGPTWASGSMDFGTTLEAAYQCIAGNGSRYAAGGTSISGATAAATVFLLVRAPNAGALQVPFAVGATASGAALGIQITAANNWAPWIGGAEVWTGAESANTAATWRTVAVTWPAASNAATLYVNAALIGTVSNTRSLTAGPASVLASPSGTLKAGTGLDIAHAAYIPAECSLAQIKALHNLLAYQYGLAEVP